MKVYDCPLCKHTFTYRKWLRQHLKAQHEIEGDFDIEGDGECVQIIPKEQTPHGT